MLASIVGLRMGLTSGDTGWPAFGLLVWYPVVSGRMSVVTWCLAGSVLDVRQGKRLFGLVGDGELLASVFGGASTLFLVAWIGTENLLLVSCGGIFGCMVTLVVVMRFANVEQHTHRERLADAPEEQKAWVRFRDLLKLPYILAIFAVYFMQSTTYQLIDFAFFDQARLRYTDVDEMARFFGLFFGLTQAVTLVLITVLTSRLMGIMGIHVGEILYEKGGSGRTMFIVVSGPFRFTTAIGPLWSSGSGTSLAN